MSNKIFKDLKEGLEELIEHSKGKVKLRISHVNVKVRAPLENMMQTINGHFFEL